ncbi:MAG TPA: peptidoglycan editing factor PgeF [Chloroflexota bacterium]|nr:peptidoglycan editing factor PgeF [Chloroflexota bacterium]
MTDPPVLQRHEAAGLAWLGFPALESAAIAVVSTRHGGVSRDGCATLNLSYSVDDLPASVRENRARFFRAIGLRLERVVSVPQVHGTRVAYATDANAGEQPLDALGDADGLITDCPGLGLFLRFADCVPILAADPTRNVVGIAHGGWRGTVGGVAVALVQALAARFGSVPGDLRLAIGPSIGPCCYTVGPEVRAAFVDRWGAAGDCGYEAAGRWHLDLWEANRRQLRGAGVPEERIVVPRICTSCQVHDFFSHRAQGGQAGRFGAVVAVREAG